MKPRWILVVTEPGGMMTSYGPWHDAVKARKHRDQLTGSDATDVRLVVLDRWPGARALRQHLMTSLRLVAATRERDASREA